MSGARCAGKCPCICHDTGGADCGSHPTGPCPGKTATPVPATYCDGGVCWKMAERWEWSSAYSRWLAVCHEHGDRIKAAGVERADDGRGGDG